MRRLPVLVFSVSLAAAASAAALVPRLAPLRDVTIDYTVRPGTLAAQDVRVEIGAGGARLRISGETLPAIALVDRPGGVATLMVPLLRAFTRVDISRYDPERTVLRGASFERHGTRTVAGLACTDWTARSARGAASACVTADGVILEGSASDAHGALGSVQARRVMFGTLRPDALVPPPDYRDAGSLPIAGLGATP